jgi:hypothetical protein
MSFSLLSAALMACVTAFASSSVREAGVVSSGGVAAVPPPRCFIDDPEGGLPCSGKKGEESNYGNGTLCYVLYKKMHNKLGYRYARIS